MKKHLYLLSFLFAALLWLTACGSAADAASDQLQTADEAMAAGEYTQAQTIVDNLVAKGYKGLSEDNLGRMAVLLMRLSEHSDNDENIAVATECYREAAALSADSLHAFTSTLTPEELANFFMVKRIATGIDNPVDLTAEEFTYEDMIGFDSIAPLDLP